MERRLATILAADVAGYSRLMELDEERTYGAFRACRSAIAKVIEKRGGRIFGGAGDSLVAEFASPLEAVRSGIEIQDAIDKIPLDLPEGHKMQFRIGINLGDVMVDRNDLFGDGVNIAARLEALADPGGVCISGNVHEHVVDKLRFRFDDLGFHELRNIAKPIRVFRARFAGTTAAMSKNSRLIRAKPSVAVLPFDNMGHDPEKAYFSDGSPKTLLRSSLVFSSCTSSLAIPHFSTVTRPPISFALAAS